MSPKFAVLAVTAAAGALAAIVGPTIPAALAASTGQAKFVRCLSTPLTVSSTNHGAWGTTDRTHNDAINEWQSAVSQQIGTNYANWANALGGDVNCRRTLFKVVCVASATPCRS